MSLKVWMDPGMLFEHDLTHQIENMMHKNVFDDQEFCEGIKLIKNGCDMHMGDYNT